MSVLAKYLCVLGIAALPVLELRGAIPYGVANGLPYLGAVYHSVRAQDIRLDEEKKQISRRNRRKAGKARGEQDGRD